MSPFGTTCRLTPRYGPAYEKLKLEIPGRDFADPLEYNAHKEPFISEHQEKAPRWFSQQAQHADPGGHDRSTETEGTWTNGPCAG